MSRRLIVALLAVSLVVLAPAGAHAAAKPPNPRTLGGATKTFASAFSARTLPAVQRRRVGRLGGNAASVLRLVRAGRLCAARPKLAALRGRVARLKGAVPAAVRARLAAATLSLDTVILSSRRARRCGGAGRAPTATPRVRTLRSDATGITLQVSLPGARLTPTVKGGRPFVALDMPGLESGGKAGQPAVPGMSELLAIPNGAKVAVDVQQSSSYVVDGVDLAPVQNQAVDAVTPPGRKFADKPFTIDAKTYASASPFPAKPATGDELGPMRDLNVGDLGMFGAQYTPKRRRLRVFTSMQVKVDFRGGDGVFADSRLLSPWNAAAQGTYRSLVRNYDVATQHLGASLGQLFCGEEILIITSPALRSAADKLAGARQADGLRTKVYETGGGSGQVGTTADQIRDFVQKEVWSTSCTVRPNYLILLGDTANVPTFPNDPTTSGSIPSDLDYGLKIKGLYLPDLAIGRISAGDVTTATTAVDKIIGYEDSPPFDAAFYRNATVTGYFQTTGSAPTQDERGFVRTAEFARGALIANGKTVSRIYTTAASNPLTYDTGDAIPGELKKPGFAWNGTGTDVINQINAGRFLLLHRDHGYETGVTNPDFSTGDVPSMTNGTRLPVVFLIDCSAGTFDSPGSPSLAEAMQRRAGGGSAAVIAASRVSPSETNNVFTQGLVDAIWPNALPYDGGATPSYRMGDVLNLGKLHVLLKGGTLGPDSARQENRLYQLFGDPSMPIRLTNPKLAIGASGLLLANGVSVSLGQAAGAGGFATLLQNGVPVGKALVGADGNAQVQSDAPLDPGTKLDLVLDQPGFVPATIALRAAAPPPAPPAPKPDLQYASLTQSAASGLWTLRVKNTGNADAGAFSATVSGFSTQLQQDVTRTFRFGQGVKAGATVAADSTSDPIYGPSCPIAVKVDSDGAVDESDETNNAAQLLAGAGCPPPVGTG